MYRWLSASHSDVLNTTTNSLMGPTERVWVCLSFLIRHTLNVTISQHSLFVCCHNLSITLIFLFKNYKSLISICINPVFGINFLLHPVSLILVTLFFIFALFSTHPRLFISAIITTVIAGPDLGGPGGHGPGPPPVGIPTKINVVLISPVR